MPALPSPGKVIRCDLIQTLGGDSDLRNRIFFGYSGTGPTTSDLTTLANTIASAWGTDIKGHVSNGTVLQAVELTDLASSTGAQVIATPGTAGTGGTPDPPAGLAMVIKFHIFRRYRGGHPRFYLAGTLAANLSSAQTWSGAATGATAAAFAAFIAACVLSPPTNIGTMNHVNVSYYAGFTNHTFPSGRVRAIPTLRVTPLVDNITSYSVNPKAASQRRRNLQTP